MKALTIEQPWVWAILNAGKDVENRSWQTKYRGWIALHASKSAQRLDDVDFPRGIQKPEKEDLVCSAICGVAYLSDIRDKSKSKWFYRPGRGETNYGWVLTKVKKLRKPVPCDGILGLWKVPPGVMTSIKRQLPNIDFTN
jgi:hypothetical protein